MQVKNRSASVIGYSVPDLHVRRRFYPGEIKDISQEELAQLLYQAGGRELLTNYLQVNKKDLENLDIESQEQEYFYSEDQIKEIITTGSIEEFLDMLDFAPDGVIDLVKSYALSLPMTDLRKVEALEKKTGFNAIKALENIQDSAEAAEETAAPARKRRVDTTTSKYKVISDN